MSVIEVRERPAATAPAAEAVLRLVPVHRCRHRLEQETAGDVVRRAQGGDRQAWNELVGRFDSLLHGVARRHGLDESEAADVAQVTWLHLTQHVGDLREPDAVAGWLATTARRESIRASVRRGHDVVVPDPLEGHETATAHPGADEQALRPCRDPELEAALRRLPPRYRQLLDLLLSDAALPYAGVAAALGLPLGSIGPMRQRAVALLRRALVERTG